MIKYVKGDIFQADVSAILYPVDMTLENEMGIIQEFKNNFPDNYSAYKQYISYSKLELGNIFITSEKNKNIFNAYIKECENSATYLGIIEKAMRNLKNVIPEHNNILKSLGEYRMVKDPQILSIAIPAEGFKSDGVVWEDVKSVIESMLGDLEDIDVLIYI